RGLSAAWWFARFVRDPVRCLCDAYREWGPLSYCGSALPWKKNEQKSVLALGPEYNRLVLGDIATFHTSAQTRGGPPNSALRRVRYRVPPPNGGEDRQQRRQDIRMVAEKTNHKYYHQEGGRTYQTLRSLPAPPRGRSRCRHECAAQENDAPSFGANPLRPRRPRPLRPARRYDRATVST